MRKQNSIFKKFVLIPLTLILLASSLTIGFSSVKANAYTNEVSLYSTSPRMIDAAAGFTVYQLNAEIRVKNIAYEKKVTIHYRDAATKDWRDCEASYSHSIDGENEVWTAQPVFYGPYMEYAIKYEVNGQTYWDNNNQKNYMTYKNGTTRL